MNTLLPRTRRAIWQVTGREPTGNDTVAAGVANQLEQELQEAHARIEQLEKPKAPISNTTATLIDLLRYRDSVGREKYGTTLDRTDLTPADWAQHAVEEMLDGALYLVRWKQTHDEELRKLRDRLDRLEKAGDVMNQILECYAGFSETEEWACSTRADHIRETRLSCEAWLKAKGTK